MSLTDKNPFDFASQDQLANMQRITVLTEQLSAQHHIDNIELLRMHDPITMFESIIVRMTKRLAYIPGDDTITIPGIYQKPIIVPATWWDAFKQKHFDVLLRWFPVRTTVLQKGEWLQYAQTYEARRYLPELVLPKSAGNVEILRWNPLTKV